MIPERTAWCKQNFVTLVAPKGKQKQKIDKRTTVDKQHTPDQASKNRTVTRVRNIIERAFPIAIKSWGILGGKNLQYKYFEHIPAYVDIASALHNAFRGCIADEKGLMDEQDFEAMKSRIGRNNEIDAFLDIGKTGRCTLKSGTWERFSPEEKKSVPDLSLRQS